MKDVEQHLEAMGLTVESLARRAALPLRTVQRAIRGEVRPHPRTVEAIMRAMDVAEAGDGATINEDRVGAWFMMLPDALKSNLLLDLMLKAKPEIRRNAFEAAEKVGALMDKMKKEAEARQRGSAKAEGQ